MQNYYSDVILVLRENGIKQIGQVGKEILAHMIIEKIYFPNATYEQICEAVKRKKIAKHMDLIQKEDLISCCDNLSEEECAVLYLIEGVETHDYSDSGREVIEVYMEKMYTKVLKRLEYGKILQRVQNLGLKYDEIGVRLMISMAYQFRIFPESSDEDIYWDIMTEYNPQYVKTKLQEVKDTLADIKNSRNVRLPTPKDIIKEGIDEMILEAAQKSPLLSKFTNVKDIIREILKV